MKNIYRVIIFDDYGNEWKTTTVKATCLDEADKIASENYENYELEPAVSFDKDGNRQEHGKVAAWVR